jgi:Tfp pilus assembly protein PilF
LELSSSDPRQEAKAFLQLGRVCTRLNDVQGARKYLNVALEIDRKNRVFTAQERSEITKTVQSN